MAHDHNHTEASPTPVRNKVAGLNGKKFWRNLDELAHTQEFEDYVHREFPHAASEWADPVSRRSFLTLMGASLALAGVTGCDKWGENREKIVPYVVPPEELIQGIPLYYSSAYVDKGYAKGVVVEQHMGRPTKVEGNPDHPASLGAADIQTQASILALYDPDRAQTVTQTSRLSTWENFLNHVKGYVAARQPATGLNTTRLRILSGNVTSPTLIAQINEFLGGFADAKWYQWDASGRDNARAGAIQTFGSDALTIYKFDQAKVILSLDSNFLMDFPGSVRYAKDFGNARRVRAAAEGIDEKTDMSRLYVVESTPTIAGAMADHALRIAASQIEQIARAVLAGVAGTGSGEGPHAAWAASVAADLKASGAGVVVVGETQPPVVHAIGHAINAALGAQGKTVSYIDPFTPSQSSLESITALSNELSEGSIDALLILGVNPAFAAPGDLEFAKKLTEFSSVLQDGKPKNLTAHLNFYYDETSFRTQWHVAESHFLESWGDARAFDGTVSILQPLISPLFDGHSASQLFETLLGRPDRSMLETVQGTWKAVLGEGRNFNLAWTKSLEKGFVEGTASAPRTLALSPAAVPPAGAAVAAPSRNAIEVVFRPDPHIGDGHLANNGWLMELPRPITKLCWDNAALISPATAKDLGIPVQKEGGKGNEDITRMITLTRGGTSVTLPAFVVIGHPDNVVTLHYGWGRERSGRIGTKTAESGGFNVYPLRTSDALHFAANVTLQVSSDTYVLANTQQHQLIDHETAPRELIKVETIADFRKGLDTHHKKVHLTFYNTPEDWKWDGHKWGMVIDTNTCIGCNACMIACQSENNIPVVGKEQVVRGREMHWLRIDTYYTGETMESAVGPYFEPLPCMHCENAPCEVVCPVAATSHSREGINEMTYNRCVGTRYCSNNCPYKVRRFNFLYYNEPENQNGQLAHLGKNPDVTVRERGVMEKCTYCIQRINETRVELKKIDAKLTDADLSQTTQDRFGHERQALMRELQTACQQTCPTGAIVFGDMEWRDENAKRSEVSILKNQPHQFSLLDELNTHPRTTYLARITNKNPAMG